MGSTASKHKQLNRESTRCKIESCLDPKDEENAITIVDDLQYAKYNGHLDISTDVPVMCSSNPASPEEHKIEDELCGQYGVDVGVKNSYVDNNGDSEMSSKDNIQEEVLKRNMAPLYVVDSVLSNDENTTHMSGRTSLDAKEDLEINEDVNPALTITVPPFSTVFARVKSTEDNIMDKEKSTVQTGTSSNDENVITMDNNRSDIQTNEQHDNEFKLIITFNESEIYKMLEQYHQRVRKDLRHLHPSPEVLELSQRSLRGFHTEIPRGENGIPIPVPCIYHRNNGYTSSAMKIYTNMGALDNITDRLKQETTQYDQLKMIFAIVTSYVTKESTIARAKDLGIDIHDDCVDFHTKFFKYLCCFVDIPCIIIDGHTRVFPVDNTWSVVNQWLGVLHDDKWMLIDPHPIDRKTWDSTNCLILGSSFRKTNSSDLLYRQQIERQFFVNPVEFVYFHFPLKPYWQLLMRPVSYEEWNNMVYLTSSFYDLKLCIKSSSLFCVEMTSDRSRSFKISFPPRKKLQFAAKLYSCSGICLDRADKSWTYVETDISAGISTIKLIAPNDAILKIFSMDIEKSSVYALVCCFNITIGDDQVDEHSSKCECKAINGFPRNIHRFEWGPGNDTHICGLLPLSHKTSEITTTENTIFIKFQRIKDDYLYDFNIEKAFADDNGTISRRFVFFWYDSDSITYRITNQCEGDIIFNVVKNEILFSSKNASVCSYLIHFLTDPSCSCIPPMVDNGKLGITKYGRREKLIFTDCVNGIIKSNSSGEVILRLQKFSSVQVTPRLNLMTSCFHNMMGHVFATSNDTLVIIRINLPKKGDYLLSLYSNPDDTDSQCLYNGLISVTRPSCRWSPYPELCMDRAYNIGPFSPKSGILAAKNEIYFSVEIPNSVDVAAVSCKGWTHLDQTNDNIWEGLVTTGYAGTEVRIMARFEIGSEEFYRLLTYKVISSAEIDLKSQHQQLLVKSPRSIENLKFDV